MKSKGGRPLGSKSNYTKKKTLTAREESSLIDDYSKMTNSRILKKYSISRSQLKNIRDRRGLKSKDICSYTGKRVKLKDLKGKCGVYAIVRMDNVKCYIGSSIDIYKRINGHISTLNNHRHYNTSFQNDWYSHEFYYCLIEELEEKDLLNKEFSIINEIDDFCLYNKNKMDIEHSEDYSIIWRDIQKGINKRDNGCWEWEGRKHKEGYGEITRKGKHYSTHRVSYIFHNDDFPMLVGHLCDNKICCNPHHLKSKSYKENSHYRTVSDNIKKRLVNKKLYPYMTEIEAMLERKITLRQMADELPIKVSPTTVFNFVEDLEKIKRGE